LGGHGACGGKLVIDRLGNGLKYRIQKREQRLRRGNVLTLSKQVMGKPRNTKPIKGREMQRTRDGR